MAFRSTVFGGLQRRGDFVDPFSDAARFPSLIARDQQQLADTIQQVQSAADAHAAAIAGGPNSVAARFDPLRSGSIFSRTLPGAYDAARDQQRQQDPSNLYYNGNAGLQRRDTAPQLSSIDRYAIDTGYQTPDQIAAQQGLSAIDRSAIDTGYTPAQSLQRRVRAAGSTFDNLSN